MDSRNSTTPKLATIAAPMQEPVHSRSAILAAMLETLEGRGGAAGRDELAASIRCRILGNADRTDPELDDLITSLIRRSLVAEWIVPKADNHTLQISAEGHHVLKLHRLGRGVLSRLIRRPRAQVLGHRGPV